MLVANRVQITHAMVCTNRFHSLKQQIDIYVNNSVASWKFIFATCASRYQSYIMCVKGPTKNEDKTPIKTERGINKFSCSVP